MKTFIFFTIVLLSVANGYADRWNLIHYSKSEEELMECLENTNLTRILDDNVDDATLKSYLCMRLSNLFHKQTVPIESIEVVTNNLVYSLGISIITNDDTKTEQVRDAITSALHECSNPKSPSSVYDVSPPGFVQEIPELDELLDMIIVDPKWTDRYPNARKLFVSLKYAKRSLPLVERALRRMNNAHELTNELIRMWNRRARLFYDHRRDPEYLEHLYGGTTLIWVLNPSIEIVQTRLINITDRDPPVTSIEDSFFEMTRYRAVEWSNPEKSSVFTVPASVSMTRSQYYFKRKLNHFVVQLFAYLESVERRLDDKSGAFKWLLFEQEMTTLKYPFSIGYEAYLKAVQVRESSNEFARNSAIFSSLVQSLQVGDQIDEFDLLMMYWHRLKSLKNSDFEAGPSESLTTTTIAKTTTSSFVDFSSTSSYGDSKRGKGQVTRLPSGKFVPKNQRKSSDNSNNNPSSIKKCKYSQNSNDMSEKYYGYTMKQSLLSRNYMMESLELFRDIFTTLLRSRI